MRLALEPGEHPRYHRTALGLAAFRVGERIEYDGTAGRVTNNGEANDLLSHKYREGWKLDG